MEEVKKIYEMIYPYGDYKDPVSSCVAIHKEMKRLCNDMYRPLLLVMARALGYRYTPNTLTAKICQDIDSHIMDICLSSNSINDRARILLGYKTGMTDVVPESVTNCKNLDEISGYFSLLEWFDEWPYDDIITDIIMHNNYNEFLNIDTSEYNENSLRSYNNTLSRYRQDLGTVREPYKSLLMNSNGDYREIFEMWYQKYKKELNVDNLVEIEVDESNEEVRLTRSQAETVIMIINLMREGKIPVNAKWKDICTYLRHNHNYLGF